MCKGNLCRVKNMHNKNPDDYCKFIPLLYPLIHWWCYPYVPFQDRGYALVIFAFTSPTILHSYSVNGLMNEWPK